MSSYSILALMWNMYANVLLIFCCFVAILRRTITWWLFDSFWAYDKVEKEIPHFVVNMYLLYVVYHEFSAICNVIVTSREHPLEVTWCTWRLGGLVQPHSYHSSHWHSKFSDNFKTFHRTSYFINSTSSIHKIYVKIHI